MTILVTVAKVVGVGVVAGREEETLALVREEYWGREGEAYALSAWG